MLSKTLMKAPLALAYWAGIAGREQRQEGEARIVCFHGTPRHRAAELERQLRYLSRHFSIVTLADIVSRLDAPGASLSRRLALTFDDGLLNNVTIGYPILRRLGLPATFFVCPGLIERGRWLWNHEARQRLHYAGAGLRNELGEQFDAPPGVEEFISWMKTLDLIARVCVERGVREATRGYQPSLAEQHEFEIADWDELRQLDPALVTFASHGMTHAILPCLTGNEVEYEVGESRRLLEARLQRAVDLFAYPNGDESAAVRKAVSRHYGAAVGDTPTPVRPMSDRYSLPRFAAGCGALRLALQMHPRPASQGGARRFKPAAAGVPV